MKPGVPWSVKGIEPEMREVAKDAARRSGMTLGEWLNSAISEQADENDDGKTVVGTMATPAPSQSPNESFERAASRLEDIAAQLSRIARQESDAATAYSYGQALPRHESENFAKILNRVENSERQSVEAFSAVNERLSVLSRQFAQTTKAASSAKIEDSVGFQTLERAVRNIVEHMESSEKRNRDNFRSLQDRMAEMASAASASNDEHVLKQAPVIAQLETRLGDLARRVESTDTSSSRQLQDFVRQEMQMLSGRIDNVRESAEQLAANAQTQAVRANQQELQTIEKRILGLLQETQNTFQSSVQPQSSDDLQHLQSQVEALHARTEEARRGAASEQDVRALRQAVEQLSTRVAQTADTRPIVEMDRRIVELAQRLHDTQKSVPQFSDFDQRFADLETRFGQALQATADPAALHGLQQQLSQVNERVERAEKQFSNFETIERAIAQLYDGLEQTRNSTQRVAEEAANRVAAQFSSQQSQPFALAGSPEIAALEEGLRAVRQNVENSDQRNQETLFAVHDTLEHIVAKLTELETAAIGQRVAAAVSAPMEAPVQYVAEEAAPRATAEYQQPESATDYSTETAAMEAIQAGLQPEMPSIGSFVPSADAPTEVSSLASSFEASPAQSEDAAAAPGESDDFIKLARQAQAASQKKSVLNGISPAAARISEAGSKKLLSRFKLPFPKKKAKSAKPATIVSGLELPKAPPPIKPASGSLLESSKFRYLAIGALLLSAAVSIMSWSGDTPAPVPSATDATPPAAPSVTPAAPAEPVKPDAAVPDSKSQSNLMPVPADDVATASISRPPVSPEQSDVLVDAAKSAEALAALPSAIGPTKLKASAAAGDAKAQFVIATQLLDGTAVPQDQAQAAYWFGRAANADLAPAQYRLATLYERGMGVEKDLKVAQQWYERAAALGNVRSMHNAAVLASNNETGAADYARAFKWFSLAASHGLKDSQFNLAVLMERGLGTAANPAEALFWYSTAAAQNDEDAKRRADLLAASLPAAAVTAVKERLASWKPQIAPQSANVIDVNVQQWSESSLEIAPRNQVAVDHAQGLLKTLGYNVGALDGTLSPRTSNAIKLFQIEQGLVADGQLTPALINLMEAVIA